MGKQVHVVRGTDVHTSTLESGAWYQLLDGAEYGFGDVSILLTEDPPNATGGAHQRHRHPHISTLVITEGQGRFTIGDETVEAAAGGRGGGPGERLAQLREYGRRPSAHGQRP